MSGERTNDLRRVQTLAGGLLKQHLPQLEPKEGAQPQDSDIPFYTLVCEKLLALSELGGPSNATIANQVWKIITS